MPVLIALTGAGVMAFGLTVEDLAVFVTGTVLLIVGTLAEAFR